MSILVIQNLQGIGDYMWFLDHIRALSLHKKQPIVLLTRKRSCAHILSRDNPHIASVLWMDDNKSVWSMAKTLVPYTFSEAWILHSRSLRYPLACRLAGIPHIFGPGISWQKHLLTQSPFLQPIEWKLHPVKRAYMLLNYHSIPCSSSSPAFFLPQHINKHKKLPLPCIGLIIGSSEQHKKWPFFAQLAINLYKQYKASFLIVGGNTEKKEGQYLSQKLSAIPHLCLINEDLTSVLAQLSQCLCVIGNDTGITHGASQTGVPSFVLLGDAQVPIDKYTKVIGIRRLPPHIVSRTNNHLDALSAKSVSKYIENYL